MSDLLVKERDVVIPGERLAEGMDFVPGENTYREENYIKTKALGLVSVSGRVIKVTSLSGPYIPKPGDKIIAKVIDITMSGWRLEFGTAYTAMLSIQDATSRFIRKSENLSKIIAIGDYVIVGITKVTSQNLIDVTMKDPGLRKISGGRIVKINCQKVPRVIGRQGSMISLIKERTGCEITVGQNGFISIKGTPEGEYLAGKVIKLIEEKAHLEGLTEKMEQFLGGKSKIEKQEENKLDESEPGVRA